MARRVNKGMKAEKAAKAECGTQLAGSAELRRWQSWLVNTSGGDPAPHSKRQEVA
jgi:hypothetical protein